MYSFSTPLSQVVGVGPTLLSYLQQRHLSTVADLLLTLPLRYSDLSLTCQIKDLINLTEPTLKLSLIASVDSLSRMRGRGGLRARLRDETGVVIAIWFNSSFVMRSLKIGQTYVFSGIYNQKYKTLTQPVFEPVDREVKLHTGRLVPLYTSTLGIKQGTLRRILHAILTNLSVIPVESRLVPELTDWATVLSQLHFPEQADLTIKAREQLAQEELINLSVRAKSLKQDWQTKKSAASLSFDFQPYLSHLPFTLTSAQLRALEQIADDLAQPYPMNRLLLGDVGSGKTLVAAIAAVAMVERGNCACLVAPTRILAEQHLATLSNFFPNIKIELVSSTAKFSPERLPQLQHALVVATHAVLPYLTQLKPTYVIFDEQQRFGVEQRSLWPQTMNQTSQPHVLTMTATPIPRSLMLTIFSHLQLSVLDEMPAGRIPTKTWFVPTAKRAGSWRWIQQHLIQHPTSLCLVVCPFIDPSQATALENVKAVSDEYDRLKKLLPPTVKLEFLHAKLAKNHQAEIIERLNRQQIQVLVTTPIIEVGIDLPTADIMVVEAADRFGLSSLHQLRGRVGRRGQQGYCLIFSSSGTSDKRLAQFCQLKTGQEVAELDLKTRGAGNLFGIEQSGFTSLRFASWSNLALIERVKLVVNKLPADWRSPLFVEHPLDKSVNPN